MTQYQVHGADHIDGFVRIWVKAGEREELDPVILERREAWRLVRQITESLEATE